MRFRSDVRGERHNRARERHRSPRTVPDHQVKYVQPIDAWVGGLSEHSVSAFRGSLVLQRLRARWRAVGGRVLPGLRDTVAPDGCGIALDFLSAARHCVGDVVTDALAFPGELVDHPPDTGARLPVLFGNPLAEIPGRFGHSLAKL